MPFENTHLFLADQIRQKLRGDLVHMVEEYPHHFYLGAVFPDTLFYSKNDDIFQTAYQLHGDDGSPTNRFVFEVLDHIKGSGDRRNFSFIAGYLTHCAADITFHPLVFYLSGQIANADAKQKQRGAYLHWYYETMIDRHLNDRFNLHEWVHPALIADLIAPQILDIDAAMIAKTLKRQIRYFSMIRSRFYYYAFRVLCGTRFVPPETIAGFYDHLKTEDINLPEVIHYRDLFSGEHRETTLNDLTDKTTALGYRLIDSAYLYFSESITRDECKKTIAGENLDTGRLDKTARHIRFASPQLG